MEEKTTLNIWEKMYWDLIVAFFLGQKSRDNCIGPTKMKTIFWDAEIIVRKFKEKVTQGEVTFD